MSHPPPRRYGCHAGVGVTLHLDGKEVCNVGGCGPQGKGDWQRFAPRGTPPAPAQTLDQVVANARGALVANPRLRLGP